MRNSVLEELRVRRFADIQEDGRLRRVDNHLPSTTVPGHLDTGRPGQRS